MDTPKKEAEIVPKEETQPKNLKIENTHRNKMLNSVIWLTISKRKTAPKDPPK